MKTPRICRKKGSRSESRERERERERDGEREREDGVATLVWFEHCDHLGDRRWGEGC